jgi:two-component system response regulator
VTAPARRRVLLVDDSPDEETFVRHALASASPDAELTVLHDGREILAYLADSDGPDGGRPLPQLILLDLKMPALDGHATLELIRRAYSLGELPIVIFTSSREPSDVIRAYAAGANSYVVKPMVFEEYLNLVGDTAHYWLDINIRHT